MEYKWRFEKEEKGVKVHFLLDIRTRPLTTILPPQQKEMEPSSQSTLGFTIRSFRLDDDLQAVRTIFQAGMRLYCDPLPVGSVVKKSCEEIWIAIWPTLTKCTLLEAIFGW